MPAAVFEATVLKPAAPVAADPFELLAGQFVSVSTVPLVPATVEGQFVSTNVVAVAFTLLWLR